ncbi:MAG: pilus assembly protein [Archangiaceae bacterium]|nr:pilus assembly protein [Archangiaceae bacterium]
MKRDAGQAMVESALTLPLVVFMVLGTIQLFMMLQGRAMAQYALARSTRAGALRYGDCTAMRHTAVAALLPTFTVARTPDQVADGFFARRNGRFVPGLDDGRNESIFWLIRESPRPPDREEEEFFDMESNNPTTLETRMVFWYPLRIPFANWVWSRLMLGYFGLRTAGKVNPLMPTQSTTNWDAGGSIAPSLAGELLARAARRHYTAPIEVTYSMKMMTPARAENFRSAACPPYP